MKLTDVEGSGDSIFFPALEQNMKMTKSCFLTRQRKNSGDIVGMR